MIKVVVSGNFDPIHYGHLKYIHGARSLGDWLIVVVNNDKQVKLKKGVPFMTEKERVALLKSIKGVDKVVLSIDTDKHICKTLRKIKPNIYCVGADHYEHENLPEANVCYDIGAKIVYGVGGRKKVQSSSSLINKIKIHA